LICSSQASIMSSDGSARVALVTGANKGIGKEIARKLSGPGQNTTVILGCRSEQLGASCAEQLRAAGCEAVFQRLDLNDPTSITDSFQFIEEVYGGDGLACSLAIWGSVCLSVAFQLDW